MSPIEVTEINPALSAADIAAVRELFLEYQRWLNLDLSFQGFAEELGSLPGAYEPPAGRLLLASKSGAIVGCVALRPLQDGDCEMKRLYLCPEGRGGGLGRRLVERVIAEARAIGYRRMFLDTLPVMGDAQRLYSKLGFVDVPPYRENPVPGARFMALEL